jgi:hypothetical protein
MQLPVGPAYYGLQPPTDTKATASMVLGILSITCFWLLAGIPAIILGHMAKSNIAKSMGRLKGDGTATAGLIMGYLSILMGLPGLLILVSIALPSIMRSKMTANQSASAATVRTLNTAQLSYSTTYPTVGYAKSLRELGTGWPPIDCSNSSNASGEHACLIDSALSCGLVVWCTKAGYRYHITGICPDDGGACTDYVITATPMSNVTGFKSFCSTNDGVVRSRPGPPLPDPLVTPGECQAWQSLR